MGQEAGKWFLEWHGGDACQWGDGYGNLRTDTNFPGIGLNVQSYINSVSIFVTFCPLQSEMKI